MEYWSIVVSTKPQSLITTVTPYSLTKTITVTINNNNNNSNKISAKSPNHYSHENDPILEDIHFTAEDVLSILASLDVTKAMGIDGIPNHVLKFCSLSLYKTVCHLFYQCYTQLCLPHEWKVHKITPIFKAGDKTSVKNYRPISLLCCISKVFERIIYNFTFNHISTQISANQFGFLRHRSTTQQLVIFLNTILAAFNCKSQTDVIYFDIRKAFDSVSNSILLTKLLDIGIAGKAWKIFHTYLSSREQCVSINNSFSDPLPVTSGVPQGSILGPLLFFVYINNMPHYINHSLLYTFADDTKFCQHINFTSDCNLLQKDINDICKWSVDSELLFHVEKTFLLRFHSTRLPEIRYNYMLNNKTILAKSSCRDLGVIFSSDLSWSKHIHHILSKAYNQLHFIQRIFKASSTPTSVKKKLYLSLILSILTYASPVWRPFHIKDIKALELFQKRATKYILHNSSFDYKSRLTKLNLLPLMYRLELYDIMFFVSCWNQPGEHFNIKGFITPAASGISTRSHSSFKLNHIHSKFSLHKHFYFNRIPRLWNKLPSINISSSSHSIKMLVLSHMFCPQL